MQEKSREKNLKKPRMIKKEKTREETRNDTYQIDIVWYQSTYIHN